MSDSKGADPSRNAMAHQAETPAVAATRSARQAPGSAATQYWLNVIATGKAAKSAEAAPFEAAKPGIRGGMRA